MWIYHIEVELSHYYRASQVLYYIVSYFLYFVWLAPLVHEGLHLSYYRFQFCFATLGKV